MKKLIAKEDGSIELIVLALLAALIVVLAIPALSNIGRQGNVALNNLSNELTNVTGDIPQS